MEEYVGVVEFFEGGFESGDEIFGEIADEPDGIGEDDFLESGESETAACRVECGEEEIFGVDVGLREGVKEGRFSGVCVADEAEDGDILSVSFFSL